MLDFTCTSNGPQESAPKGSPLMVSHHNIVRSAAILLGVLVANWAAAADAATPEAVTNSLGMKLVPVRAGTFEMGAHEDPGITIRAFPYADRDWFDGELPQHKVRLAKPFLLGATEVTLGEFRTFCTTAHYKTEAESDGQPSLGYSPQGNSLESRDFKYSAAWLAADGSISGDLYLVERRRCLLRMAHQEGG